MKNEILSTYQLFKLFPNEKTARKHLEQVRWNDNPICPECKSDSIYIRKGEREGMHDCRDCGKHFSVRTGTVFEKSHIHLHKWIYAIYLLMTARKGISSMQLSKEIGTTQKTAWFMLHRLRVASGNNLEALRGIVEVDETYIGGKESNKHNRKKSNAGRGGVGKQMVLGMRERGGKTIAKPVKDGDLQTLQGEIYNNVEAGSTVCTDEHRSYLGLDGIIYKHRVVKHSVKEFVRGMAHTNGIESIWAVLKRGYNGVYHQWSKKHMRNYINEFSFRMNEGNCKYSTIDRVNALILKSIGTRITYKELTQ